MLSKQWNVLLIRIVQKSIVTNAAHRMNNMLFP